MEKLLSNRLNDSAPESFIVPIDTQPGKCFDIPACKDIPVIDLGGDNDLNRKNTIGQIINASKEYGFFQVINHGVPEKVISDMMGIGEEFFQVITEEDKASLYSEDRKQLVRIHTSGIGEYDKEHTHYWRDRLVHPCHPLEKYKHVAFKTNNIQSLICRSSSTANFQLFNYSSHSSTIPNTYTVEVRKLAQRLMELIAEGLGMDTDYFRDELCTDQFMAINHYAPCPDPSLTLGLPRHCDPNTITLLLQGDLPGLQVQKNGEWIGVEPLPNAFVVNLGNQLQIVSNGILHSVEHRVVTNPSVARTTIANFLSPPADRIIQPAKELIDYELNPPKFGAIKYEEFLATYHALNFESERIMKHYMLQGSV